MAQTKNLCAQVPIDLHQKISEAREQAGLTTAQYITNLITEYFKMKENVMMFPHDGKVDVVLPFGRAVLEPVKLAAWQIMTYPDCCGAWRARRA